MLHERKVLFVEAHEVFLEPPVSRAPEPHTVRDLAHAAHSVIRKRIVKFVRLKLLRWKIYFIKLITYDLIFSPAVLPHQEKNRFFDWELQLFALDSLRKSCSFSVSASLWETQCRLRA